MQRPRGHRGREATEAAEATASLLRAAGACEIYRRREDTSGEQRALLMSMLEPLVELARSLITPSAAMASSPAAGEGMRAAVRVSELLL